jgi:hypothetical protein
MANLSASAVGCTGAPLVVEAVTYGHTACHRRSLFDALVSVGHDLGIQIDGFRVPGI